MRAILPVVAVISAIGFTAWTFAEQLFRLVTTASKGIDLSDESFYVQSAAYPHMKPLEGPWGDLLHYLYRLAGGDLADYRALSICVLVASGCLMGGVLGSAFWIESASAGRRRLVVPAVMLYALIGGDLTLIFYGTHILTPGYNWVNLVGLNLSIAGLVLARAGRAGTRRVALAWSALLALGSLLVFSARIATFLILLVVIVVSFSDRLPSVRINLADRMQSDGGGFLRRQFRICWPVLLVWVGLIGVYLTFVATPHQLLEDVHRQAHYGRLIHQLRLTAIVSTDVHSGIDTLRSGVQASRYALLAVATVTGTFWVALAIGDRQPAGLSRTRAGHAFDILILFIVIANLAHAVRSGRFSGGQGMWTTMSTTAVAILEVVVAGVAGRMLLAMSPSGRQQIPIRLVGRPAPWALAFSGVGMPLLAFAFGVTSANGIVVQTSLSSSLIVFAAAVLLVAQLQSPSLRLLGLMALSCVLVLGIGQLIDGGIRDPYRVTAIGGHGDGTITLPTTHARVQLARSDYAFLHQLQVAAADAGFKPGTAIEDFSPFQPGIGLVIGARPAPSVFLAALTPDPKLLAWTLSQQPLSFRGEAWIVVTAAGPSLAEAARVVGCHAAYEYQEVFSGYWAPEAQRFYLYKPPAGLTGPQACPHLIRP